MQMKLNVKRKNEILYLIYMLYAFQMCTVF